MNELDVEIKYLSINWNEYNEVEKIYEEDYTIPINKENKNNYNLEIETYYRIKNKYPAIIAFHIKDDSVNIEPFFLNEKNKKIPLLKIINPLDNKIWWIEKGVFNKINNRTFMKSILWNNGGLVKIVFNSFIINMNVKINGQDKEVLDLYLKSFEEDLWFLILQNDTINSTNVTKNKLLLNEDFINSVENILTSIKDILINPKKQLYEIETLQNINKVKPTIKTYIDLVKNQSKNKVRSKDFVENINIPDNQYIYFILLQISNLINNIENILIKMKKIYDDRILLTEDKINSMNDDFFIINKNNVYKDLKKIEKDFEKEKLKYIKNIDLHNEKFERNIYSEEEFTFIPKQEAKYYKNGWFCEVNLNNEIYDNYIIKFSEPIQKIIDSFQEYTCTCSLKYLKKSNYQVVEFEHISILKTNEIKKIYDKKIEKIEELEQNEWKQELTTIEKKEQKKDKELLNSSLYNMNISIRDLNLFIEKIQILKKKIKNNIKFFKDKKIKKRNNLPNSMTFVQNKNYKTVHSEYTKIKNYFSLDQNSFIKMSEFSDRIGMNELNKIYERWVYLQIIKVLINHYKFIPEKKWKEVILNSFLDNSNKLKDDVRNLKLSFSNKEIEFRIDLYYEYELENKKRPDFILDFISTRTNKKHRLVMDAKFHNDRLNLEKLIEELYYQKDYSESGKNTMFIIHDNDYKELPKVTSTNIWSKYSYYGENNIFDFNDENNVDHKYGGILVSGKLNDNENLKRLISMIFQYKMQLNDVNSMKDENNYIDTMIKEKLFCIQCLSTNIKLVEHKGKNGLSYDCICQECENITKFNYCWKCQNRLIKNGKGYNFHANEVFAYFDIKCPICSFSYNDYLIMKK